MWFIRPPSGAFGLNACGATMNSAALSVCVPVLRGHRFAGLLGTRHGVDVRGYGGPGFQCTFQTEPLAAPPVPSLRYFV